MVSVVTLNQLLQSGAQALGRGDLLSAATAFETLLGQAPGEATASHLLGIVRKRQGRLADAEHLFRQSLKTNGAQAEVLNNLGNLLRDMRRPQEALGQYEQATRVDARLADAWFNWGVTLTDLDHPEEALPRFDRALALKPSDARYHNARGVALKDMDRLVEAMQAYSKALEVQPNYFRALHNMGVVLRMQDRQAEALAYYEKAMAIEPRVAELRYNLGNALYELGQYDAADEQYRIAIGLKPDFLEAHRTLNQMYWEHGKADLFSRSYRVGIKAAPTSAPLWDSFAQSLELAGRFEESEAVVDEAFEALGPHPDLLRRKARVLANRGAMEEALGYFRHAVDGNPTEQPFRMDIARLLIQMGGYDEACIHLDAAEKLNPFDQEMWAYRGLCWRFLNDPREEWLNDYERFVMPQFIDTPSGYGSIDTFMAELKDVVTAMHVTKVRPLEQTLRGGTQTPGRLFLRPVPVVQKLREQLEICIQRYIASLPDDDSHPLLSRKSNRFRFAGSWSVRLSKDGFHVNHVHPEGWISSSFYVDVPADNGSGEGAIKFGESGLSLGDARERIARVIQPEPGMLALFPSYMWHGTVPFHDDSFRLTTPFDVVPV